MRKLGLSLVLIAGAAAPVAAQQMWQPEIGIRAGWTRLKDPNSSTHIDGLDFPMTGGFTATNNASGLYGVIPVKGRFAIQPSFGLLNFSNSGGGVVTTLSTGVRLNVAIASGLYVAAGPTMYVFKQDGNEDTQGGIEAAVGYRRAVGGRLHGSVEGFYEKREKSEALPKLNAYGLRLGMGYSLTDRMMRRAASRSDRMWSPSIGIQGGWSLASFPGGNGDVTSFTLPFMGQSVLGGSFVVPGPSALSVLLPVGKKLAIEPSVDYHRVKVSTSSSALTTYQLGARVNYAFNRTAYAGLGAEYTGLSASGVNDGSHLGAVVAAGLRFPLVNGLMGRTELNYRVVDGDDALPSGQVTSFVFGVMLPLN